MNYQNNSSYGRKQAGSTQIVFHEDADLNAWRKKQEDGKIWHSYKFR